MHGHTTHLIFGIQVMSITSSNTITQVTGKYFRVNTHTAFRRLLESRYGVTRRVPVKGSPLRYPAFVKVIEDNPSIEDILNVVTGGKPTKPKFSAKVMSAKAMTVKLARRKMSKEQIAAIMEGMA